MRKIAVVGCIGLLTVAAAGADQQKAAEKLRKAEREYAGGRLPRAEKLAREAIQEDPGAVGAHSLLGDVLTVTRRHSQAAEAYTAALKADAERKALTPEQKRTITNQQGAAYGLGGDLDRAQEILEGGIRSDPEYPLFYYNLACVYAEKGQLEAAVEQLREGWKRRGNLSDGERFPDPRKDSSFARYVKDSRFEDAVREMVF
jgi:predicted Zn-dependent protease